MSFPRNLVPVLAIVVLLCLLAALLPAAVVAAPGGKSREYIVTLQVAGSGRSIEPSSRTNRARIRQRAKRADEATTRIKREHGVKPRQRFGHAFTGFSAAMTADQAAAVAADPQVVDVRPARTFELAAQQVQPGVKRVKAWTEGSAPGPDVNAWVAVVDTGIGPSGTNGWGERTGEPIPMTPVGAEELNIRGGVNCYDDPWTDVDETVAAPGAWADTHGHGTHVAGIIGARDNSVGTVGVAPGVKLWSVRVFGGDAGTESSIACGLDRIIERNSDGNAGNDIDVVNMSIQGPRLDLREDCGTVLADPRGDPIQKGICTLTDMGVTVVASAGNDGMNANRSSPGGFDRVVSVAAMTDTDGSGWGQGGRGCGAYRSERDDTFASYSNHGREIDIVAPGTCVVSTSSWDPTGGSVVRMTGTSMAAPHVTGAVARYVDAKGSPSSTWEMRNLLRASGRLDWKAKSDPVWSGVNDSDPPNRVLDVRALTGGDLLRAWIQHDTFKVGRGERTRTTRVDVQRGGGYAGTANLAVTGLDAAVGSAAFTDASLNGTGRANLGANVTLKLAKAGNDGVHELGVRVNGAGVEAHSRKLTLTIDRTGPAVSPLATRVRGGNAAVTEQGAAQAYLEWDVDDALSNVAWARLQRKINGGAWRNAGTGGNTKSKVFLKPGQRNKFRVKARDSLGNVSYGPTLWTRMSVRDSSSTQWLQPARGGWKVKQVGKAFGGSILVAKDTTDSMRTTFRGKAIALMASIGPGRGQLRVRVDGGDWQDIDLRAPKAGHRKVVWSRRVEEGSHTLEVQGEAGQATLDALLIVR
ncbi:MAG: S8 family serine peptidase [Chloroflexota bacterium]